MCNYYLNFVFNCYQIDVYTGARAPLYGTMFACVCVFVHESDNSVIPRDWWNCARDVCAGRRLRTGRKLSTTLRRVRGARMCTGCDLV